MFFRSLGRDEAIIMRYCARFILIKNSCCIEKNLKYQKTIWKNEKYYLIYYVLKLYYYRNNQDSKTQKILSISDIFM